jgi:hypothetical protein
LNGGKPQEQQQNGGVHEKEEVMTRALRQALDNLMN